MFAWEQQFDSAFLSAPFASSDHQQGRGAFRQIKESIAAAITRNEAKHQAILGEIAFIQDLQEIVNLIVLQTDRIEATLYDLIRRRKTCRIKALKQTRQALSQIGNRLIDIYRGQVSVFSQECEDFEAQMKNARSAHLLERSQQAQTALERSQKDLSTQRSRSTISPIS